jgi:hypothetical protein
VSSLLVRCWRKDDGNLDVYLDDVEWSESRGPNVKCGTKELNKWKVGRQVRAVGWRSLRRRRPFIGRGEEISFYVAAAKEMRP